MVDMPDLMHKPSIFEEITGEKTIINKNIKHDVSQFVDDLTYSIGAGWVEELKWCVESYMSLLEKDYAVNWLKINTEKMTFMVLGHWSLAQI